MDKRQVVLDTETTGLEVSQGHRIIEIGCVELVNRRVTGRHFHQYIHPEREIDEGAMEVHGITLEFLSGKPNFGQIAADFIEFVHGAELIIHNAAFDVGFLDAEFHSLEQRGRRAVSARRPISDACQPTARPPQLFAPIRTNWSVMRHDYPSWKKLPITFCGELRRAPLVIHRLTMTAAKPTVVSTTV